VAKKKTDKQKLNSKKEDGRTGEHLRPWWFKEGHSGNPNGRPKEKTLSETANDMLKADYGDPMPDAIKRLQETMPPPWKNKPTLNSKQIISWIWIRRAMTTAADTARRDLADRVDGKPMMRIDNINNDPPMENAFSLADFTEDELRILQTLGMRAMQRKQNNNGGGQ
jgi:hypothetical protein